MVEEKPNTEKIQIKTSKWRFSILFLTWAYKFITSFQYVECLYIPNVVSEYFQIQVHLVSQIGSKHEMISRFSSLIQNVKWFDVFPRWFQT